MILYVLGLALVLKVKILHSHKHFKRFGWDTKDTHIHTSSNVMCPWIFEKKKKVETIMDMNMPAVAFLLLYIMFFCN